MRIEKNKILVNKEKPDLVINSPVITFRLEPKPTSPLQNPFRIEFKRSKVSQIIFEILTACQQDVFVLLVPSC